LKSGAARSIEAFRFARLKFFIAVNGRPLSSTPARLHFRQNGRFIPVVITVWAAILAESQRWQIVPLLCRNVSAENDWDISFFSRA
jgi:hypothetical protein